jgi:hypothetical protein
MATLDARSNFDHDELVHFVHACCWCADACLAGRFAATAGKLSAIKAAISTFTLKGFPLN